MNIIFFKTQNSTHSRERERGGKEGEKDTEDLTVQNPAAFGRTHFLLSLKSDHSALFDQKT